MIDINGDTHQQYELFAFPIDSMLTWMQIPINRNYGKLENVGGCGCRRSCIWWGVLALTMLTRSFERLVKHWDRTYRVSPTASPVGAGFGSAGSTRSYARIHFFRSIRRMFRRLPRVYQNCDWRMA